MRILHVIHSLDLRSGGPSHALVSLLRAQLKLGLEPLICCTDRQAGTSWKPAKEFVAEITSQLPTPTSALTVIPSMGRTRPWVRYGFSFQCRRTLQALLTNEETAPSFVHIHGLFSQITSVAARLSRQFGIPHAIRPTGALDPVPLSMGNSWLKRTYLKLVTQPMLNAASFVHTTSEPEAQSAAQYVPKSHVKVMPLGINLPELDPAAGRQEFFSKFPQLEGHPFILCLSRIHPKKNLELSIRGFHDLAFKEPTMQLVIAGENPGNEYQQRLAALISKLDLNSRVHFIGFLEGAVKSGAFYAASCFLQTSHHENFGVSLLESMAHGLKVVSTPGVASSCYLAPSRGGEVAKETPEAVSQAIQKVIRDGDSNGNTALQAWVRETMSWEQMAASLNQVYQDYAAH